MSPKIEYKGNPLRGYTWTIKDDDGTWLTSRSKNFPDRQGAAEDARKYQGKIANAADESEVGQ